MPPRAPSTSRPDPARPNLSPTFDLEPSPPRAPVRRNLFSAHLSRRPASTQTSELPASHSASSPRTQALPLFAPPQPSIPHPSPFTSRPPQLHPSFSAYDPTINGDEEALESQRHDAHIDGLMARYRSRQYARRTAHAKTTGLGRHPRAQKEEELMNHLKSALRREVCRAEEEAWMFGEVERSWVHSGGLDQDLGGMVMGGSAGVGTAYE
ncbi:hypothetical protein DV737_g3640, partial [Chaetothyriales sp. CBS 132003]